MDLRDGGDNQEEAHELVAGGEESSEEYASLALSDNDGECEQTSTGESATCGCLVVVSGDSGCEEAQATSPAVVSGDSGGVLAIAAEVDVESEGHEEDDDEDEEDGYVTPTSPSHRLRAPVVCPPPPPRPRRALTTAAGGPRGRKRICAELDLGRWSDSAVTRVLFADAEADELFSAFVKRRQLAPTLH
ncbi:hypothetical protein ABZP36_034766 [Zizania latifolia]